MTLTKLEKLEKQKADLEQKKRDLDRKIKAAQSKELAKRRKEINHFKMLVGSFFIEQIVNENLVNQSSILENFFKFVNDPEKFKKIEDYISEKRSKR